MPDHFGNTTYCIIHNDMKYFSLIDKVIFKTCCINKHFTICIVLYCIVLYCIVIGRWSDNSSN